MWEIMGMSCFLLCSDTLFWFCMLSPFLSCSSQPTECPHFKCLFWEFYFPYISETSIFTSIVFIHMWLTVTRTEKKTLQHFDRIIKHWDFRSSFIFYSPDFSLMYSVSVSTVAWVLILEPVWSHSPISVKLQIHSGKAFIENYVTVAFVRLCIGNALQADWQNSSSGNTPCFNSSRFKWQVGIFIVWYFRKLETSIESIRPYSSLRRIAPV